MILFTTAFLKSVNNFITERELDLKKEKFHILLLISKINPPLKPTSVWLVTIAFESIS